MNKVLTDQDIETIVKARLTGTQEPCVEPVTRWLRSIVRKRPGPDLDDAMGNCIVHFFHRTLPNIQVWRPNHEIAAYLYQSIRTRLYQDRKSDLVRRRLEQGYAERQKRRDTQGRHEVSERLLELLRGARDATEILVVAALYARMNGSQIARNFGVSRQYVNVLIRRLANRRGHGGQP